MDLIMILSLREFNFQVQHRKQFSLQGSEMFIESATSSIIRAPAERNVSARVCSGRLMFRSAGARKNLLEVARSINISPLMGRRAIMFCCTSKLNSTPAENGLIPGFHFDVQWFQYRGPALI